jgi:hypothetical protein
MQLRDTMGNMDTEQHAVWAYLHARSLTPDLYEAWATLNRCLFNERLEPMPILRGLTRHGAKGATCSPECILIQPHVYASGEWLGVLAHEMCHQADHQDGLRYASSGRVVNIHNSATWCNRINAVMQTIGDARYATPYRRNRAGAMVPTTDAPAGLALVPYEQLKGWLPDADALARAIR